MQQQQEVQYIRSILGGGLAGRGRLGYYIRAVAGWTTIGTEFACGRRRHKRSVGRPFINLPGKVDTAATVTDNQGHWVDIVGWIGN